MRSEAVCISQGSPGKQRERAIYLAHMTVGPGKSEICRVKRGVLSLNLCPNTSIPFTYQCEIPALFLLGSCSPVR